MGHRAYVLYERDDGLFNAHYSHWGAHDLELVQEITESTPLGGDNNEPAFIGAFTQMLDGASGEMEIGGYLTEAQETTAVEADPEMVGVTVRDVVNEIDVMIEALFVVDRDFNVTGYHGLHSDEGVLLYDPGRFYDGRPVGLSYKRGYFQALKETLPHSEAVDKFLEKIEDSLDETILAKSPAIDGRRIREYPGAFVEMHGRTRKGFEPWMDRIPEDSRMVATTVVDPPSWALPSDFEIETTDGIWTPG